MEEGNVRGDIPGSRNSGSGDTEEGFVNLGDEADLEQSNYGLRDQLQWNRRTAQARKERGPGFVGTQ